MLYLDISDVFVRPWPCTRFSIGDMTATTYMYMRLCHCLDPLHTFIAGGFVFGLFYTLFSVVKLAHCGDVEYSHASAVDLLSTCPIDPFFL